MQPRPMNSSDAIAATMYQPAIGRGANSWSIPLPYLPSSSRSSHPAPCASEIESSTAVL